MAAKQTESAPSFLQVYTQVRRDRMIHSFLRQINASVDWRGIPTLLNKKSTKTHTQDILEAMVYNLKRMPGLLVFQGAK
ncbi:hypothetical protein [Porphyromonas sp.]